MFDIIGKPFVVQHVNPCAYSSCTRGSFDGSEHGVRTTEGLMHMLCALYWYDEVRSLRVLRDQRNAHPTITDVITSPPYTKANKTHAAHHASTLKKNEVLIVQPCAAERARPEYKMWIVPVMTDA